jgi:hypothetical protein
MRSLRWFTIEVICATVNATVAIFVAVLFNPIGLFFLISAGSFTFAAFANFTNNITSCSESVVEKK